MIRQLPQDRDVVVYLGYDLLNLGQYDELLQLTSQYDEVLPKEPDIPLLAGYVHSTLDSWIRLKKISPRFWTEIPTWSRHM